MTTEYSCLECGKEYREKFGTLTFDELVIKAATFFQCWHCGDVLIPHDTAIRIDEERRKVKLA